jgi:hypothetical protein
MASDLGSNDDFQPNDERSALPVAIVKVQSALRHIPSGEGAGDLSQERLAEIVTDHEEFLIKDIESELPELRKKLDAIVRATLGPSFVVSEVQVMSGSVVLTVFIGVLGAYDAVSKWKDFRESLVLLSQDVSAIFRRYVGRSRASRQMQVTYTASATPIPGAKRYFHSAVSLTPVPEVFYSMMMLYLLFTHAVMLGVILLALARRYGMFTSNP